VRFGFHGNPRKRTGQPVSGARQFEEIERAPLDPLDHASGGRVLGSEDQRQPDPRTTKRGDRVVRIGHIAGQQDTDLRRAPREFVPPGIDFGVMAKIEHDPRKLGAPAAVGIDDVQAVPRFHAPMLPRTEAGGTA
jgi:hypothetical protein